MEKYDYNSAKKYKLYIFELIAVKLLVFWKISKIAFLEVN